MNEPQKRKPYTLKYGERLRRVSVTLDTGTIERATAAGNGSLSAGIRAAFNPRQAAAPAAPASTDASPDDSAQSSPRII